jgi:hypothetical protein
VELELTRELQRRFGRETVNVAVYTTAEDKRKDYNRAANVRAIAPGSEPFEDTFWAMRADIESLNRWIEDSMYRHRRAHSFGRRAQEGHDLLPDVRERAGVGEVPG